MTSAPLVRHLDDVRPRLISPGDTVRLATLVRPSDGTDTSVLYEVWEPGGAQPPNSHPDSAETFVVLRGTATAYSDEHVQPLQAGDTLVLPAGSVHRIVNTSATTRLYTITVMADDGGFEDLIRRGTPAELDDTDLTLLRGVAPASASLEGL